MHLSSPRIAPVPDSDWNDAQRNLLAPLADRGPVLNIFRTLARAPEALKGFLAWGGYVLSRRNSLPARERELIILRIGFLCRSGYEWAQHVPIGLRAGLTDDEVQRIKQGAAASGWSEADQRLLQACDELHHGQFVSDATWVGLRAHFDEAQCMDVVFTAGQYTQVSMMLNSFDVQLDPGQALDPDLKAF
jgi:alkylhydroperoxidase family enzyme